MLGAGFSGRCSVWFICVREKNARLMRRAVRRRLWGRNFALYGTARRAWPAADFSRTTKRTCRLWERRGLALASRRISESLPVKGKPRAASEACRAREAVRLFAPHLGGQAGLVYPSALSYFSFNPATTAGVGKRTCVAQGAALGNIAEQAAHDFS